MRGRGAIALAAALGLLGALACGTEDAPPAAAVAGTLDEPAVEAVSAEVVTEPALDEFVSALPVLSEHPPDLTGTQRWINSAPTSISELTERGQVVAVEFWTYTCYNCVNVFPSLRAWHDAYGDLGLTIVGVHTPEFEFERVYENVLDATERYELEYPIVQDNEYATWHAFGNRYWPSLYLIDAEGRLRYRHIGEGAYAETEAAVRLLLMEAGSDLGGVEPIYR